MSSQIIQGNLIVFKTPKGIRFGKAMDIVDDTIVVNPVFNSNFDTLSGTLGSGSVIINSDQVTQNINLNDQ